MKQLIVKSKALEWKTLMQLLEMTHEEVTIYATEQAVILRVMSLDKAHIVDVNWPNTKFEKFECMKENNQDDKPLEVAINVSLVSKALARPKNEDDVEIKFDNKVDIKIGDSKHYELPTVFTKYPMSKIPQIKDGCKFDIPIKQIHDLFNDLRFIDIIVGFESNVEKKSFRISGHEDIGRGSTNMTLDKIEGNNSKSEYSLDFLIPVTSAMSKYVDVVNVEFGTDSPLKLKFINDNMDINYFLAPKVLQN